LHYRSREGVYGCFEGRKIVEFYGEAGTGKTNICLHLSIQSIVPREGKPQQTVYFVSIIKPLSMEALNNYFEVAKERYKLSPSQFKTMKSNFRYLHYLPSSPSFHDFHLFLSTSLGCSGTPSLLILDSPSSLLESQGGGLCSPSPLLLLSQYFSSLCASPAFPLLVTGSVSMSGGAKGGKEWQKRVSERYRVTKHHQQHYRILHSEISYKGTAHRICLLRIAKGEVVGSEEAGHWS